MKKTVFVVFLVAAMLAVNVLGAFNLDFVNVNSVVTKNPGDVFDYTYEVKNVGTENATAFTVVFDRLVKVGEPTISIFDGGNSYVFNNVADPLEPTEITPTQLRTAGISSNQKAGNYKSTFNVTYNSTTYDQFTLDVSVNAVPNTALSAPAGDFIQGKNDQTVTVTVINTGNTDLNFNYNLDNLKLNGVTPLANLVSPSAGGLLVPYQQTKTLTFEYDVPANQPEGNYTGKVTFTDGAFTKEVFLSASVRKPVKSVSFSGGNLSSSISREELQTKTLSVTNTGDIALTNVVLSTNMASQYTPQLTNTNVGTLNPGATVQTQLSFTVSENEDSGTKNFGSLQLTGDSGFVASTPLTGTIVSELKIDEVKVKLEGENKKSVSLDGVVKNVLPFTDVEITVNLDNTFDIDNDIDLNEVTVTISGIDDGDDIELDGETSNIKDGKDKDVSVSFTVPETVAHEEEYDVEIHVEGEDDNGATHSADFSFSLQIEKEKHNLVFDVQTTPEDITLCTDTYTIDLTLTNLGREDEDDVVVNMVNDDLDINVQEDVGDMSSDYDDDEYKFQKFYTMDLPSNVDPGSYKVELEVFINEDELEDRQEVDIDVSPCSNGQSGNNDDDDNDQELPSFPLGGNDDDDNDAVEVVSTLPSAPGASGNSPGSNVVTATPVDSADLDNFRGSVWYIVLLLVGNLAIIGVLLVLIAKVLKKR